MIIKFSVADFRSFKEVATLSMVAAPIPSHDKKLDRNNMLQAGKKLTLLHIKSSTAPIKWLVRQSVIDENVIRLACDDLC